MVLTLLILMESIRNAPQPPRTVEGLEWGWELRDEGGLAEEGGDEEVGLV